MQYAIGTCKHTGGAMLCRQLTRTALGVGVSDVSRLTLTPTINTLGIVTTPYITAGI